MKSVQWISDNGQYILLSEMEPFILNAPVDVTTNATAHIFKAPGQDGATTYSAVLNQPNISIDFTVIAKGNQHLTVRTVIDEYKNMIVAAFRPKTMGWLIYNNDRGGNIIRARPVVTPTISAQGEAFLKCNVELLSDSAVWQDYNLHSVRIGTLSKLWRFPLRFPMQFGMYEQSSIVTSKSLEPIWPIFEVFSQLENCTVTNDTTGEFMTINHNIGENQFMRIDTEEKTVALYENGKEIQDVSNWLEGEFISLVKGENILRVQNDVPMDIPAVVMSWRDNVLGV